MGTLQAEERDTLFQIGAIDHGGFGGFGSKVSRLNGETQTLGGIKGAWLLNKQYYLGFAGYGTHDEIANTKYGMGYGGLLTGVFFKPKNLVRYNLEMIIGGGSFAEYRDHHQSQNEVDSFFVFEPAANVNLALAKYVDLSFGASYRFVDGIDLAEFQSSDIEGWSVSTSLIFGTF